jgi:hypothetical protein
MKAIVEIAYTSPDMLRPSRHRPVMYVEEKPRSWPK